MSGALEARTLLDAGTYPVILNCPGSHIPLKSAENVRTVARERLLSSKDFSLMTHGQKIHELNSSAPICTDSKCINKCKILHENSVITIYLQQNPHFCCC